MLLATTRILIVDRFPIILSGLRRIIESRPNWVVVAEANNGLEAVRLAVEHRPDIAVVGYVLPRLGGPSATAMIRRRVPEIEVLIHTMHATEVSVSDTLRAGASGYVVKSENSDQLIAGIEALAERRPYFTGVAASLLLSSLRNRKTSPKPELTPRERNIVQLVAEGKTNKEAAFILDITQKTVESHRSAAMQKLKLSTIAELVRYAIRNGLVEP